eukprot:c18734_g1_i1 orf=200-1885(+)
MKTSSCLASEYLLLLAFCLFSLVATAQSGICPNTLQSEPEDKRCFYLFSNSSTWDNAEVFCKNRTGHLAAVTTQADLHYVQDLCNNSKTDAGCWVGGRLLNSSKGFHWKWSDNQAPGNSSMFPSARSLSNCSGLACEESSQLCTLVTGAATLVEDTCNSSHVFVCTLNKGWRCRLRSCNREYIIILGVVGAAIFITTLGVVLWLLIYRRSKQCQNSTNSSSIALVPPSWRVFTIKEVRVATKNFSDGNRLGGDARTGGTYRGVLPDGSLVAIKRLKKATFEQKKDFSSQKKKEHLSESEKDFLLEVGRIARYRHPNLVAVKGCCFKHGERYIIYEFMANGPLDRWLHHLPKGARSLDWGARMRIAVTLAQGIAFLHDKVKPHVVHRDIRASNVLLDEEFNAHILGVGLGRFVPWEAMRERTVMAGRHGYLAPEFVYRNELTTKSDVYSFGVLLLELVSGRKPAQTVESVDWQDIFEWATPLVQSQNFSQLLDPVITTSPDISQIQKVVKLVYDCTQHVPSMRPRMSFIVHQLQQLEAVMPQLSRGQPTVNTTCAGVLETSV